MRCWPSRAPPLPARAPRARRNERRAFLDPYAQFNRFSDGNGALLLDEFLDAKDTVAALSAEYEACEHADYVSARGGACRQGKPGPLGPLTNGLVCACGVWTVRHRPGITPTAAPLLPCLLPQIQAS